MQISGSNSNAYGALGASSNGISGLASGMDTQAMVEKMLSGQQTKINKQKAAKQVAQWKQNIYRDVISRIDSFQKKFFDFTSSTALHSNGFFNQMKSTTTSTAFRITGSSSSAITGDMRMKIDQLAEATKLEGNALDATNQIAGSFNPDAFVPKVAFTSKVAELDADGNPVKDADGNPVYTTQNIELDSTDIEKLMNNESVEKETADGLKYNFSVKDGRLTIEGATALAVDMSGTGTTQLGLSKLGLRETSKLVLPEGETKFKLASKINKEAKPTLDITLDGDKKTIEISKDETLDSFKDKIKLAFGDSIKVEGNDLSSFTLKTTAGRKIVVGGSTSGLEAMGLKNGQSNLVGAGDTIMNALRLSDSDFDADGNHTISINGKDIVLSKNDTVSSMMNKINKSDADVNIQYDEFQNKFILSRKSTGAGYDLEFGSNDAILTKMFGADPSTLTVSEGKNAIIEINGVKTERNSNNFTLNGISFELLEKTDSAELISTTRDTEAVFNGIKSFVDEYNTLIKDLNKLITEDPDYKEYPPLTDEQRKEMSQGEIDAWEKKAQVGLLRSDSDISSFLSQLRLAIYQKPDSAKFAMFDIGIETSNDTKKGGELVLDEAKLKEMLNTNISDIQELFTFSKTKEIINDKGEKEIVADGVQGISTAFKDIIKKMANTSSGSPGVLVQLAGYANTGTDKKNALHDQMQAATDRIKTLTFQYEKQKARYWNQFNAMEKALAGLSSQSSWLTQQFG